MDLYFHVWYDDHSHAKSALAVKGRELALSLPYTKAYKEEVPIEFPQVVSVHGTRDDPRSSDRPWRTTWTSSIQRNPAIAQKQGNDRHHSKWMRNLILVVIPQRLELGFRLMKLGLQHSAPKKHSLYSVSNHESLMMNIAVAGFVQRTKAG